MSDASPTSGRVLVAIDGTTARVRVIGLGSLKVGPPLREFFDAAESANATTAQIDLTECESLDSTFMGLVAGLGMRLRRKGGGVLAWGCNERVRRLLATLGVDKVIEVADRPPPDAAARLSPLETAAGGGASAETLLRAHEDLVAADEGNRERFRDVIDYLREHVRGSGPAGGGAG